MPDDILTYNPFSLKGKSVLVTGASSGIGQKTAIECSRLGAKVIVTARNEIRLRETLAQMQGDGHCLVLADLTNQEQVGNLAAQINSLDGIVLCAGKGMTLPFQFCTREKYDELFDVNYFAPVELLRLLVKKKKLCQNASVVFVSSIGGNESFNLGNGIYGATKAALSSTMKFCAKELASKKIRVNAVEPGMINTNLIQDGAISEEQLRSDMQQYPLGRYGETEDVAWGIVYLLSDASSWVTGHELIIDGGKTI